MLSLWYCCQCSFGPHNSSLYDACLQCGIVRCARCVDEATWTTSQTSPKTLPIHDSRLTGEGTPPEAEMTRQASHRPTGNRERLQRRAAQPDADNINLSSNRNPPIQKERLRSFRSGVELFLRRGSAASTDTPFNDPVDNTRSQNFPTPQASSSSVEPRHSSTSAIVYSSSLGSILVDWVYEQFSRGVYSSDETQALENVLVELKNTKPKLIFVRTEDGMSRWNTLKGNAERIIGGMLDWWPFQPYITPLAKEQVRLRWECACGDTRWAAVPQSFGIKIEDVFENNAAQANQENVSGNDVSHSGARTKIQTAKLVSESALPRPAVNHQNPANPRNIDYQLHAFLILLNSSIFGSVHCLAQTAVHNMSDHEFFTWIRNSYYSQRGFLAIWFGLFRFSHCEFFRFRRFDGYEYAPLLPEYPDDDQPFYHFAPKPMRPRPPMASHEFNHWFYRNSWSRTAQRLLYTERHRATKKGMCFPLGSKYVVEEKIPKRETALEEGVPASEDFWGLYVVERRSVFRLGIYSLFYLSPSVYFFFAWLFQWGHVEDLQSASIPIALSLAPLATFWGFVLSTSPGFDNTRPF